MMVQGKTQRPNYKVHTPIPKSSDEWVRVDGTHEPIIRKSDFDTVEQLLLRDTRTAPGREELYLYAGYLYCGDCGSSMVKKNVRSGKNVYSYYVCSANKNRKECSCHSVSEINLNNMVLAAIQKQIEKMTGLEELLERLNRLPSEERNVFQYGAQMEKANEEIERLKNMKLRLYEDLKDGLIGKEGYSEYRSSFSKRISDQQEILKKLDAEREKSLVDTASSYGWVHQFTERKGVERLDRRLVVETIDRIDIYENKRINVTFRYKEETEQLAALLDEAFAGKEAI